MALSGDYQYEPVYEFEEVDEAEGDYQVVVRDGLVHERGVDFAVTRDVTAPVAYVGAPSTYVSGTFSVRWGAQDPSTGSGQGDGEWVDWLTGTTGTEASFTGELGHVYSFPSTALRTGRVRTGDNVGNERAYPDTPDAVTRIQAPITKYYYANGQRASAGLSRAVAIRVGGTLRHFDMLRAGSAWDELRTGDPVSNRLSLVTSNGSTSYEYDAAKSSTPLNDTHLLALAF